MKSDNRAKAGLLQSLEIPSRKRAYVITALVTDLLESNGFMVIVVFIDKLTKMVHLTGCKKEVTAMEYAQIFDDNVFWLHGLPKVIKFWRAIFDLLRTDLQFSIAFHP